MFAAVDIPEFPVAAWLRGQSAVSSHPAAVLTGEPPLERIYSLNAAALSLQLTHAMSRTQAETVGKIIFRSRSPEEEQSAYDQLLEIANTFSPRVQAIATPKNNYRGRTSARILIEQDGTERLFGNPARFARRLARTIHEAAFQPRIAITPNAEASLLLARSLRRLGNICIDNAGLAASLAPLPLALLECDDTLLAIFRRWGIRTLGDLTALPQKALISRIGQKAVRLQRLALGCEEHLLLPEEDQLTLHEHTGLDEPLELLESLLFILSPMLERIMRNAIDRAYALRSVTLTLQLEKAPAHELFLRPALPTQNRDLLLKLIHLQLQAHPPSAPILAVTLTADPAAPQRAQRGLFQGQSPESDKLDLLLARLRAIAGDRSVGSPALTNSHASDDYVLTPYKPSEKPPVEKSNNTTRPTLMRYRPPLDIRVLYSNGSMQALLWKGERLPVLEAAGPWESSGCWWDGRKWHTSEWDVLINHPPQTLRLRCEHPHQAWQIIGIYD